MFNSHVILKLYCLFLLMQKGEEYLGMIKEKCAIL